VSIGPGFLMALIVGLVHTAIYVLIRGESGGRLPLTYLAAALGSWAGAAIGAQVGMTFLAIGDFALVPASIVAWLGIAFVAIVATLGPDRRQPGS
jgi:L-cysteine desulfidase